ncbi:hypothetical protein K3495_g4291 [Podosphaera aphanis]|nr:hypothetical protein K3495_g4291 [Podosphaera aphanis]
MAPPNGVIPPELPPSVEEAYRAKCIQLKQRLNEIEESNDGARARLVRINRSIQKSRLERAFLLEQLAKRTSTNVEDSEGSPSPPPTPKEKPLRSKRGHRKPDFMNIDTGEVPAGKSTRQGPAAVSPSSDSFSHINSESRPNLDTQTQSQPSKRQSQNSETRATPGTSNAVSTSDVTPKSARDVYRNEARPRLAIEHRNEIAEGSYDIEAALSKGWSSLDAKKKEGYIQKFQRIMRDVDAERDAASSGTSKQSYVYGDEEDVEMADETSVPTVVPEFSGFTPVNRN